MSFLICFLVLSILVYFFTDTIRKHSAKWYYLAAGICCADILLQAYLLFNSTRLQGTVSTIESYFSRGILGTALISVVMYVGALNGRWDYTKKIRSIRSELSIIACFFILPHNVIYAYHSTKALLRMLASEPSSAKTATILISIFGIIAVSLLIPLFITSFKSVRKKMKPQKWKKLQSFSYLFYAMIYAQIMVVYLGFENRRNFVAAACYSIIFVGYAVLRISKKLSSSKKKS